MVEIFKEIIDEFHKSKLPEDLSKRDIQLPALPKGVKKAFAFIGMRRSGKTYMLYQVMKDLLAEGLEFSKILYINFEDDRLLGMQVEAFQDLLRAYFELYPNNRSGIHFFFDEIHEVTGWEKFIRRLLDKEDAQIYITGSSAKLLSKEIASTLRGRTLSFEVFPFSFPEVLNKLHITVPRFVSGKDKIELMHHMRRFLKYGGFPAVINASPSVHQAVLQEYTDVVIYRDIVERYGVCQVHAIKYLLTQCLRNSATVFSINKIYHALKSLGMETGRDSLYEYMGYFEDAYCVFSISKFDLSHRKSTTSMSKVFAVDPGLIAAVSMASDFNLAAQLETAVFGIIRRLSPHVYYYRTMKGSEVDFVIVLPNQALQLVQVSLSLKDESTRKREIAALTLAMDELGLSLGTIVTLDEEEEIALANGIIRVMPIWKLYFSGI